MSFRRYENAKNVALTVALLMVTSALLTGCTEEPSSYYSTNDSFSSSSSSSDGTGASTSMEEVAEPSFSETGNLEDLKLSDLYFRTAGDEQYYTYEAFTSTNKITPSTDIFYLDPQDSSRYVKWEPSKEDWDVLLNQTDNDGAEVLVDTGTSGTHTYVPYYSWWYAMSVGQRSQVNWQNTHFATQTETGGYSTYKPSSNEMTMMQKGSYTGRTTARPAVSASSVSGSGKVSTLTRSGSSSGISSGSSSGSTSKSTSSSPVSPSSVTSTSSGSSEGGHTSSFGGSSTRGGGSVSTGG